MVILNISVPGVAQKLAFSTLERGDTFFLFNKRHKDLVHLFLSNNVGGPAIVFNRFQEAGESISSISLNWVKKLIILYVTQKSRDKSCTSYFVELTKLCILFTLKILFSS